MDIRQIDPHDQALVRRHWEVSRAADVVGRPYDFFPPWESSWLTVSQGRPDFEMVLLGAFEGDTLWGAARIDHPLHDNLHAATAEIYTHPDRSRRGIGRALAEASYDVARARGRRVLTAEAYAPVGETSAGVLFGAAMGFEEALVDGMKVVDLVETAPLWDGLAAQVAPRHAAYTVVTWQDHVPDELVADYCRLNEMFMDEAPMGELDVEPERWDESRVREREERNLRQGRRDIAAGAVAADGTLVGVTEAVLNDAAPERGFQSGTLVDPAHRGHGLGLAIKLANHRRLREHFPQCRLLMTGNADVNAPMNAVNVALGYREVERCVEMQRTV